MDMENTTNHLPGCGLLDYEAWASRWTGACDRCGGSGVIEYPGSRLDPPSADPCPKCVDSAICPRGCGETTIMLAVGRYFDYTECLYCGWSEYLAIQKYNWDNQPGFVADFSASTPECWCDHERCMMEAEAADQN